MIKKTFILALAAGFIYALAAPVPSTAQFQIQGPSFRDVIYFSDHVQDDTAAVGLESPAMWVKYVGSQESGTVDGITNGFEFFAGPLGSQVINGDGTDLNAGDVCGTTNDTLLYNDAECNTPEELCSVINAANANWVCALAGAVGSDSVATDADYIDAADAEAKLPGGFPLKLDNSATNTLAYLVRPDIGYPIRANTNNLGRGDIEFFLRSSAPGSQDQDDRLIENPFESRRVAITTIVAYANSTNAWTLSVYARKYRADGAVDERLVYQTVETTDATDEILDFSRAPLVSGVGETFVIEILDDALVDGKISVAGFFFNTR
jgi:hypothetical protein